MLSIVIPTHNRILLLLEVLEALLSQSDEVDNQLEILIVDDGSTEAVESKIESFISRHQAHDLIRYYYQDARGPAAARNLGISKARGTIVLFLGDDILPLPGLLQHHFYGHTIRYPEPNIAILGMAELASEYLQTPFARWWKNWNFRYHLLLEGKRRPDFSFFYTNNISLKRQFLLEHGTFDEAFRYPAYEDGELGARLIKQGLEIIFDPTAQGIHYHEIDFQAACRRMVTRGKGYDLFVQKTGMLGLSRIWSLLGSGPWMTPAIIRPLYHLAQRLQYRANCRLLYIIVLMYFFHVGRGKKTIIPEIS